MKLLQLTNARNMQDSTEPWESFQYSLNTTKKMMQWTEKNAFHTYANSSFVGMWCNRTNLWHWYWHVLFWLKTEFQTKAVWSIYPLNPMIEWLFYAISVAYRTRWTYARYIQHFLYNRCTDYSICRGTLDTKIQKLETTAPGYPIYVFLSFKPESLFGSLSMGWKTSDYPLSQHGSDLCSRSRRSSHHNLTRWLDISNRPPYASS